MRAVIGSALQNELLLHWWYEARSLAVVVPQSLQCWKYSYIENSCQVRSDRVENDRPPSPALAEKRITEEVHGGWEKSKFCNRKKTRRWICRPWGRGSMRQANLPPSPASYWRCTASIRSSAFLIVTLKKCLLCPLFSTSSTFPIRRGRENLMKKMSVWRWMKAGKKIGGGLGGKPGICGSCNVTASSVGCRSKRFTKESGIHKDQPVLRNANIEPTLLVLCALWWSARPRSKWNVGAFVYLWVILRRGQ